MMTMDCNLKILAIFFQVPFAYFGTIAKKMIMVYSYSQTESFHFFPRCSKRNFTLEKRFLIKYLSSFEQHSAKSP